MNYVGDANGNTVTGTAFKDTLDGQGGADVLNGVGSNDSILGGDGADTLYGGAGKDTMLGGIDNDYIDVGQDDDIDYAYGNDGADIISGRGKDFLQGGDGSDYLALYLANLGALNVDLSGLTSGGTITFAHTTLSGFESGFINFGNGDDKVRAPSMLLAIVGGEGNDTLLGGAGNDELHGEDSTHQADTMKGGDGSDNITGAVGDLLDGGPGASDGFELYMASAATDLTIDFAPLFAGNTVQVGEGTRVVRFERGAIQLGGGDDKVETGSSASVDGIRVTDAGGNDTLIGGDGRDNLSAGDGNDVIRGGGGIDIANYQYAFANLVIDLNLTTRQDTGQGMDLILACENVYGGSGEDRITGDNNANQFEGYGGADTLIGGQGADTLNGGSGGFDPLTDTDRLIGGAGQDVYNGGAGNDVLVWSSVFHTTVAAPDHIISLEAGDVIDLSGIDADTTVAGDQAFTIVAAFTGVAGQLAVASNGIQTQWQMDVDGDAGADAMFDAQGDQTGHAAYVL